MQTNKLYNDTKRTLKKLMKNWGFWRPVYWFSGTGLEYRDITRKSKHQTLVVIKPTVYENKLSLLYFTDMLNQKYMQCHLRMNFFKRWFETLSWKRVIPDRYWHERVPPKVKIPPFLKQLWTFSEPMQKCKEKF